MTILNKEQTFEKNPLSNAVNIALTESLGAKVARYYQVEAAEQVADYLRKGFTRIEVKMPTGSGKTLTSKLIALSKEVREAIGCGHKEKIRILFLSHRHRLNRQAIEEFLSCESVELIPHSAFSKIPDHIIEQGWDMTFIDECHHEAMLSVQMLLNKLIEHPIIGFTADDERGDGVLCKFERVVCPITEAEAAERGFIEKAGINTVLDTGGTNKVAVALDIIDNYSHCMGNTIVFFRTSTEVREFSKGLKKRGLTSAVLDEKSTESHMDKALNKLSTGKIQYLINCQKIGEGVDVPNCTDVMLMRNFNSKAEKKQYIGRAIRIDSPCGVWELMNPLTDSIAASECVGGIKYERLIYKRKGEWLERMITGVDTTWGEMSKLRVQPSPKASKADTSETAFTQESGGALNLKKSGINTNVSFQKDLKIQVNKMSLDKWREKQGQMSLFDEPDTAEQVLRVNGSKKPNADKIVTGNSRSLSQAA